MSEQILKKEQIGAESVINMTLSAPICSFQYDTLRPTFYYIYFY